MILNVSSNVIKVLSGFIFFLILTRFNDPVDLGKIGQLLTFSSALVMLSSLGIQNKLIQDFASDSQKIDINYLLAMASIAIPFFIVLYFVGKIFFFDISIYFGALGVVPFSVSIVFAFIISTYSQFKYAMFNGIGEHHRIYLSNILGSIVPLVIVLALFYTYDFTGYQFYIILLYPIVKACFLIGGKTNRFKLGKFSLTSVRDNVTVMRAFIFMTLISVLLIYGYQYYVRFIISSNHGWEAVGQWQILQKHSEVISLLFSSIASMFIIPKFARCNEGERNKISINYARLFLLLGALGFIVCYFIGDFYVTLIFGNDYSHAGSLLSFYIIGDIFKISAYCFTLQALCSADIKSYLYLESIQYLMLLTFYYFFMTYGNPDDIPLAYSISYGLFLIITLLYYKYLSKKKMARK